VKDLSRKSTSAVVWGGMEIILRQGIGLVLSIILARLLEPKDFGVLAMLSIFVGVAGVFVNSGFGSALIQRQNITREDTSSVFYFNIATALIMALLLVAAAPYIAAFYRMPILKSLTWVMAFNLFLGSFRSIQAVLLTKELNFRRQMKITLVATIISGGTAIGLAWRGWGIWSLAIQTVVSTAVSVLLFWVLSPWRPAFCFSLASLRSLFRYGSFLALSGLLDTAYTRLNTLIIGRFYSARDLGLYSRADNIQQLPTGTISTLLGRVAFPVFSAAAAGEPGALHHAARKALTAIMLVNTPMMFGILATARPLVHVVFGEKWLPCVPFLQVLALAGVFWPLHVINLTLIQSRGRSDLFFRLEVIKKLIGVSSILVASSISMMAMAWSQVLVGIICYFINSAYSGQLAGYPIKAQIRDMLPYLAVAGLMLGSAKSLSMWTTLPPAILLTLQVLTGATLYLLLCHALKLTAFRDAAARLRDVLARNGFISVPFLGALQSP
jgi:O-antigen/teichoic acid export membrane protein